MRLPLSCRAMIFRQQCSGRREGKVSHELLETFLGPLQVVIVAIPGGPGHASHPRLIWIYFPGMQIENNRPPLRVTSPHEIPGQRVGVKPEITSSTTWNSAA